MKFKTSHIVLLSEGVVLRDSKCAHNLQLDTNVGLSSCDTTVPVINDLSWISDLFGVFG